MSSYTCHPCLLSIAVRFNSAAIFNIVIPEGRPSRPIRDLASDET